MLINSHVHWSKFKNKLDLKFAKKLRPSRLEVEKNGSYKKTVHLPGSVFFYIMIKILILLLINE